MPALIVVFLSFIIPVAGLGWLFGDLLIDQIKGLIEAFPTWWSAGVEWVRARAPKLVQLYNETALGQAVGDAVEGQGDAVVDVAQYLGRRMVSAGANVAAQGAMVRGVGAKWGELPERLREEIEQFRYTRFPLHYQRVLEEYFRALADEESKLNE